MLEAIAAIAPPRACRCEFCSDLIPTGYRRCARCRISAPDLASLTPIALAPSGSPLHGLLRGYKDCNDLAERDQLTGDVSCLLWAFLARHQRCVAHSVSLAAFDLVAVVPSAGATRDRSRPRLRDAVAEIYGCRARILRPNSHAVTTSRVVDPSLYETIVDVAGAAILLIDDTWVTGSRMRSAAAALTEAGAAAIAGVVVGRHVSPAYRDNAARLARLPRADFERCTNCAPGGPVQTSSNRHASTSLR